MAAKSKGMTIAAIGSITLIMTLGNSMLIPILRAMRTELKLSQMQVSLTITIYSIDAAIFIPILGYCSDRYSRKMIIIPSVILSSIGGLLAGFAAASFNTYALLIVGRIVQGKIGRAHV